MIGVAYDRIEIAASQGFFATNWLSGCATTGFHYGSASACIADVSLLSEHDFNF
jgi:hypothetical protein